MRPPAKADFVAEGFAPQAARLDVADRAQPPVARVGVEDDVALDARLLHDPALVVLDDLVGVLDRPELRHDQVRVGVGVAPEADRAQSVDADDPGDARRLAGGDDLLEQRRVLLVEQPARRVPDEFRAGPCEVHRDQQRRDRIEPREAGEPHEQQAEHDAEIGRAHV